jgi:multiple sugar transport system permease protein
MSAVAPFLPARRQGLSALARREEREFYLYISPWLLGLFLFTLGPLVASFVISFMDWVIVKPPTFIGLSNYREMLADPLFWQSLKVTSIYTFLDVPLRMIASLLVAIALNQQIKGVKLWRTIYYMPSVVPSVAVAMLFIWMLARRGLVNQLLGLVGLPPVNWFSEQMALYSLIIMSLWGYGASMVIFLAGLQNVPAHLYEAAAIDGAGTLARFRHITIPMISPVILFNTVMAIIGTFQVFTTGYVVTGGGPNNATLFYVLYLYRNAFQYFRMGYACSLAWVLFVIILACTALVFRSSPAWVYYEAEVARR